MLAGEAHSFCFQNDAQAVDFLNVLLFEADDKHAAPGDVHNEGLLLQLLQSFSHGSAADVEVAGKLALVQALSWADLATENGVRQHLDSAVFERSVVANGLKDGLFDHKIPRQAK